MYVQDLNVKSVHKAGEKKGTTLILKAFFIVC